MPQAGADSRSSSSGLYEPGFAARFLRRPARVDDPHHHPRRRRGLRQRHLLERHRIRRVRRRHRGPPQQHARRGGPEPVRLPRNRSGAEDAVDDVADDRPPRRPARARARQRRLEPDPLGRPRRRSSVILEGRARPERGRPGTAPALRGRHGPRRARRRPGSARRLERPATRSSAGASRACSSVASTRSRPATVARRRPGTRAAAAPSRSPSDQRVGSSRSSAIAPDFAVRFARSASRRAFRRSGEQRRRAAASARIRSRSSAQLEQPLLVDRRHLDLGGDRVGRPGGLGAGRVGSDCLEQLRERLARRCELGGRLGCRLLDRDHLDARRRPVVRLETLQHPERRLAADDDVHAAVVMALGDLGDEGRAADRAGAVVVAEDDSEGSIVLDAVGDHQPVAGLEDVQRHALGREPGQGAARRSAARSGWADPRGR